MIYRQSHKLSSRINSLVVLREEITSAVNAVLGFRMQGVFVLEDSFEILPASIIRVASE